MTPEAPPTTKHPVPCKNCQTVTVVEIEIPRVFNMPSTSLLIIEHSKEFICPGCLRLVTPCLTAATGMIFESVSVRVGQDTPVEPLVKVPPLRM